MSNYEYSVNTQGEGLYNITENVLSAVRESGVAEGLCIVYCAHTSAGITINESADPDMGRDLLAGFARAFPDGREFRHMEGNASAYLKAGCIGASQTLIVEGGRPLLGVWQGVFFGEFNGPHTRKYTVKVMADPT